MTPRTWLLLGWIVVGASGLVAHAVLLWLALRADKLSRGWRLAALLPPLTPVAAWRAGKRAPVVVWGVLVVTYAVLRALVVVV